MKLLCLYFGSPSFAGGIGSGWTGGAFKPECLSLRAPLSEFLKYLNLCRGFEGELPWCFSSSSFTSWLSKSFSSIISASSMYYLTSLWSIFGDLLAGSILLTDSFAETGLLVPSSVLSLADSTLDFLARGEDYSSEILFSTFILFSLFPLNGLWYDFEVNFLELDF